jgi:hypothetical protein
MDYPRNIPSEDSSYQVTLIKQRISKLERKWFKFGFDGDRIAEVLGGVLYACITLIAVILTGKFVWFLLTNEWTP